MMGEIEFKVIGNYNPNNDMSNPLIVEYEEVMANILTEGEMIEVDGKPILDAFNAWDDFEAKVIEVLDAEEDDLEDDSDDVEELDADTYIEPEEYEDDY
jgi:hypothetical protein